MLSSLAGEFADKNIKIVNLYDVTKDTLDDGVHPNATGQKAIASAFKTEINSFYSVTGSHDGKDIEVDTSQSGLPSDFFVNGAVNPAYELVSINGESTFTLKPEQDKTGVIRYKFALPLPKTDSEGNPLTYYVQEVSINGYTTSYDGNGQSPGNDKTPIRIINTAEEVTGLTLEKIWSESGSTTNSEDAEPQTPLDRIQAIVKRKINAEISSFTPDDSNIINETATDREVTHPVNGDGKSIYFDDLDIDVTGLTKIEIELSNGSIGSVEILGSKEMNGWQHENSHWLNSNMYTVSGDNKYVISSEKFPSPFVGFFTYDAIIKNVTLYYEAKTPVFSVEVKGNTNLLYDPETNNGEQAQIIVKNGGDSATYSIDEQGQSVIEINSSNGVVTAIGSGTATVTVTGKNGNSSTITFTVTSTVENVFEEPIEFKDSGDGIWLPDTAVQEELKHLPMTDESGRKYLYYIEEIFEGDDTALQGYEKPRYFDDTKELKEGEGVELTEGSLVSLKVVNTRKESSTTTMPSTGGNGARKYYTVGGMLMLLSACGWAMRRRKRVIPH